jgi:hypothetical protein
VLGHGSADYVLISHARLSAHSGYWLAVLV